jgi:hypothetical protein
MVQDGPAMAFVTWRLKFFGRMSFLQPATREGFLKNPAPDIRPERILAKVGQHAFNGAAIFQSIFNQ